MRHAVVLTEPSANLYNGYYMQNGAGDQFQRYYGGAVTIDARSDASTATFTKTQFISNTATHGGAVYIGKTTEGGSMATFTTTEFVSNTATREAMGGAVYIGGESMATFTTTQFESNIAVRVMNTRAAF